MPKELDRGRFQAFGLFGTLMLCCYELQIFTTSSALASTALIHTHILHLGPDHTCVVWQRMEEKEQVSGGRLMQSCYHVS